MKLLIVDDKDSERQYLRKLLDWQSYGIAVAGEASNGTEGFALANRLLPDIVMTDIVMPEMDGISLTAKLRENFPNIKIIIMSCYSEFRYAQYAVKYKVSDYILKPIIATELDYVIRKVAAEISGNPSSRADGRGSIEDLVKDNLNELTKVFVLDLLEGKYRDEKRIEEKLKVYKLGAFCGKPVMVVKIDCEEPCGPLLYEAVGNLDDRLSKFILPTGKSQYAAVLGGDESLKDRGRQLPYDLKSVLKDGGCRNVTIGASTAKESVGDLSLCYEEANQALDAKFYLGKNRVILYGDLSGITYCTKDLDMKDVYEQLKNVLHTAGKSDIKEFTEDVINACVKKNKLYAKVVMIHLISCCQIFLLDLNRNLSDIFQDEKALYEKMLEIDTIPEIRQWIFDVLNRINDYIVETDKNSASRITDKVREIIKARYPEKLTLDKIAAEIHYHPVYINSVLKQATGKTFLQMLIEYRLQRAMELLENSDLKVYEICEKVGYWNQSYFTQAFKEFTGTAPKEYRELRRKEGGGR